MGLDLGLRNAPPQRDRPDARSFQGPEPQLHPAAPAERGNRATQELLRRRRIQAKLRVAPPGDPLEQEADLMAAAVAHPPGACHCGGTCASCQGGDDNTLLHRAARDGAAPVAADLPDGFLAGLGAGERLAGGPRADMEQHFERDFGDVRIHRGAEAASAAQTIGARAFTAGADIAFDGNEYQPETPAGRQLLAHELTHVTQQGRADGTVHRQQHQAGADPGTGAATPQEQPQLASVEAFQAAVFARAESRLAENLVKLEEWRGFLASAFDDLDLQAQIDAGEAARLAAMAQANNRQSWYESMVTTRSPASRRFDEAIVRGEIHGGCQACHESNTVWAWNAAHPELTRGPNMVEILSGLATHVEGRRTALAQAPGGGGPAAALPSPAPGSTPAATAGGSGPVAAGSSAPAALAPPTPLVYPRPRSDLCGEVPPAGRTPQPGDAALWGQNSVAVLQAIARIHPMLAPLGPEGYQIIPEHVFTDLYQVGPAALRAMVNTNLDERRDGFYRLAYLIAAGQVDYTELCPIVDELLATATPDVRTLVLWEIAQQRAEEAILDALMQIAMVALLFLSVMLPPAAPFVAVGLGAMLVGSGAQNMYRGSLYMSGTGAGVFSPEQVASGPARYTSGAISIAQGLLMVGTGAMGIAELGAPPETAMVAPEPNFSEWNVTEIPNGELMFTNPSMPEAAAFADAEGLSCWVGDDEVAFYPWSTAQPSTPGTALMLPEGTGAGMSVLPESPPLSVFPESPVRPLLPGEAPLTSSAASPAGGGILAPRSVGPPIDYRLQGEGNLRLAAREIHDLAHMYPSDIRSPRTLASTRSRTSMTVSLAEVELPGGARVVYGSGSGNSLSPIQRSALEEYGIHVVGGDEHAEINIIDALPPGARVVRWGISWAGNQRPDPCPICAPRVQAAGGVIE